MAKTYEGRPCRECSATTRYASTKNCVACSKKKAKQWRRDNQVLVDERHRKRWHEHRRYAEYGITRADFDRMAEEQKGKCAGCANELKGGGATHIDHCHSTNRVRGLLCRGCNQALGLVRDSVATLVRLANYVGGA